MSGLLNEKRPPVFCPGCSHEKTVHILDSVFSALNFEGSEIAIVTDIGCCGLFDTFFNTHALHGLHGRALTYATGLKIAQPALKVIVIMGDGGLGIGGAHVLSSCRRNLDITLLVLNNFNYGMTGGQYSATTPTDSSTSSGFLNQLEAPLDICSIARSAGAPWVARKIITDQDIPSAISGAISYPGFSLIDIWGICPGRYSRKNKGSLKSINEKFNNLPPAEGPVPKNNREEFGSHYRAMSGAAQGQDPPTVDQLFPPRLTGRYEVLMLGSAGQRVNTAGEILCLSAMSSGINATLKNDYPITVLRGHSVCEVVLSPEPIDYTGIDSPNAVIALSPEGVARRKSIFSSLKENSVIIASEHIEIPKETRCRIIRINLENFSISSINAALSLLVVLGHHTEIVSPHMVGAALKLRFSGKQLEESLKIVESVSKILHRQMQDTH